MKPNLLLLTLVFSIALSTHAQTKPTASQFSYPCPTTPAVAQVLVITPTIPPLLQCVTLSSLIPSTSGTEVSNETVTLTSGPLPSLTLQKSGTITGLKLYRNGIRLTPAVDYTLSGNVVTFIPVAAPQQGDIVTCDYRFQ